MSDNMGLTTVLSVYILYTITKEGIFRLRTAQFFSLLHDFLKWRYCAP